jgi:hypothetical protein
MSIAAPPTPATAQLDAARQFDFLLGEWDCTWSDGERGTDSVYLDLDDKVVVESFDGRPSLDYQGVSHSVYDRSDSRWKQTWVDTDGNYLDFVGGFSDGVMDLRREAPFNGGIALFRLRWFDIERDALRRAYERSDDGGETWTTLWAIDFRRVL